ncbi:MAG: ATP-dependent DNA helicase RecG [Rhodothermaeota bacterium MED-G64]|nr:MAG: ATP-dependent DNA helicase RecG [Rhodothermaeota bacterium MED-G64]RPF81438.1 MAG: ATP-dependent DNA helicase RecG [Rhodothermaceae bacterium TMED105]
MEWSELPYCTPKRVEALGSFGLKQPEDLLRMVPGRYIDKQTAPTIRDLFESIQADSGRGSVRSSVRAEVVSISTGGFGKKKRTIVKVKDATGEMDAVWFHTARWLHAVMKPGTWVSLSGDVKLYRSRLSVSHPEFDVLSDGEEVAPEFERHVVAIYPSGKEFAQAKISHRLISMWVDRVLKTTGTEQERVAKLSKGNVQQIDVFPKPWLERVDLLTHQDALRHVHQPESIHEAEQGLRRLKFEEFFFFEMAMAKIRGERQRTPAGWVLGEPGPLVRTFVHEILPFELTEGQTGALSDIRQDLESGYQMNRLLQGDVGSGKTVVAMIAMLMAVDAGFQATLLAPTEVLADQHARSLQPWFEALGVRARLLKGAQRSALRQEVLDDLAGGGAQVIIGTHAVIQQGVTFAKLGLAVIDEQHRFGVGQRSALLQKGDRPHLLVMSATPIPRSLAMTMYSDLELSIIRGLPAGRKPIKTAVRGEKQREKIYDFIASELDAGGQAYVVYPLVEESEKLDLKNATDGFESLKARFSDRRVALIHGQQEAHEKDHAMQAFANGEVDVLVSTTVIEVGVNVPNANVMLIEHAERFGLSQLHQLRGRIGRGERASTCILIHGHALSEHAKVRLKTMAETQDGFKIADVDLELRGPGDFLGTRQSGLPEFTFGSIVDDQELLSEAKIAAAQAVEEGVLNNGVAEWDAFRRAFEPYFEAKIAFYQA